MKMSMGKKSLVVAVILLFLGIDIAPCINANVGKSSLEAIIEGEVITKEVGFQERTSNEDCGCNDDNPTRFWTFPIICTLLFPLFFFGFGFLVRYGQEGLFIIAMIIGAIFNCWWYRGMVP
jgi:hypothetical protein